jgi:hypothetical protein
MTIRPKALAAANADESMAVCCPVNDADEAMYQQANRSAPPSIMLVATIIASMLPCGLRYFILVIGPVLTPVNFYSIIVGSSSQLSSAFRLQEMKQQDLVSRIVLTAAVVLSLCGFCHIFVVYILGLPEDSVLRRMFDLGYEKNVPTWLSSQIWLLGAAAAFFCSWCDRHRLALRISWGAIGAVFLFASIDDTAEIHENVGVGLRELLRLLDASAVPWQGSPGSPWLGFYGPIIFLTMLWFVIFLRKRLIEVGLFDKQRLVLFAVACYSIAMGMDYFQGMRDLSIVQLAAKVGTTKDRLEDASIFIEEMLECAGGILFATVFMRYGVAVFNKPPELPAEKQSL